MSGRHTAPPAPSAARLPMLGVLIVGGASLLLGTTAVLLLAAAVSPLAVFAGAMALVVAARLAVRLVQAGRRVPDDAVGGAE